MQDQVRVAGGLAQTVQALGDLGAQQLGAGWRRREPGGDLLELFAVERGRQGSGVGTHLFAERQMADVRKCVCGPRRPGLV